MGIISYSYIFSRVPVLSVLLAPLQTLTALFVPANPISCRALVRSASKPTCRAMAAPVNDGFEPANHSMVNAAVSRQTVGEIAHAAPSPKPTISRLKILREFDPGIGRTYAGRMIISGRMADVCAELDRIEQRESTSYHC